MKIILLNIFNNEIIPDENFPDYGMYIYIYIYIYIGIVCSVLVLMIMHVY